MPDDTVTAASLIRAQLAASGKRTAVRLIKTGAWAINILLTVILDALMFVTAVICWNLTFATYLGQSWEASPKLTVALLVLVLLGLFLLGRYGTMASTVRMIGSTWTTPSTPFMGPVPTPVPTPAPMTVLTNVGSSLASRLIDDVLSTMLRCSVAWLAANVLHDLVLNGTVNNWLSYVENLPTP